MPRCVPSAVETRRTCLILPGGADHFRQSQQRQERLGEESAASSAINQPGPQLLRAHRGHEKTPTGSGIPRSRQ